MKRGFGIRAGVEDRDCVTGPVLARRQALTAPLQSRETQIEVLLFDSYDPTGGNRGLSPGLPGRSTRASREPLPYGTRPRGVDPARPVKPTPRNGRYRSGSTRRGPAEPARGTSGNPLPAEPRTSAWSASKARSQRASTRPFRRTRTGGQRSRSWCLRVSDWPGALRRRIRSPLSPAPLRQRRRPGATLAVSRECLRVTRSDPAQHGLVYSADHARAVPGRPACRTS